MSNLPGSKKQLAAPSEQQIRAFLAIPPDRYAKAFLTDYQQQLMGMRWSQGVRWVKPEQFHLTVRFLGDLSLLQIQELVNFISQQSFSGHLSLTLTEPSLFPAQRPHTIVARVPTTPELGELVDRVEKCAQSVGVAAERRKFRGHITLGRLKDARQGQPVLNCTPSQSFWTATHLVLYQSNLTPQGAIYQQLASWSF
ncbi:MAG: RNA 2',3'-cyclic phosphodiesterase [Pseudanabaenaceae cyanobacterium SKYGB_i_bin29]|nr:RNA 2',3'-cyclic phosphodiesterase [Pseudanabaenaceae cyanobacterium SKYG29]MDW8421964.1 RNA 2',3'-cyclic phosphodiesterase [Pseudanabaenaceae cyanobacterium SKYGB_i_bin29]